MRVPPRSKMTAWGLGCSRIGGTFGQARVGSAAKLSRLGSQRSEAGEPEGGILVVVTMHDPAVLDLEDHERRDIQWPQLRVSQQILALDDNATAVLQNTLDLGMAIAGFFKF